MTTFSFARRSALAAIVAGAMTLFGCATTGHHGMNCCGEGVCAKCKDGCEKCCKTPEECKACCGDKQQDAMKQSKTPSNGSCASCGG